MGGDSNYSYYLVGESDYIAVDDNGEIRVTALAAQKHVVFTVGVNDGRSRQNTRNGWRRQRFMGNLYSAVWRL